MNKITTFTLPLVTSLAISSGVFAETTQTTEPTAKSLPMAADASSDEQGYSFNRQTVIDLAEQLSKQPMQAPARAPEALNSLDYDTYQQINFQQNQAVWGNTQTPFSIQLFAPGFLYKDLVEIDAVENGKAFPIEATEESFVTPTEEIDRLISELGKFAGLRLHYPINRADYKDEFIVFQGASYFKAISKGQEYGISARGLALDVAQPKGEEFPMFRHFWIERPSTSQQAIVVHALLDSKSVTGAYRFGIFPGSPTRIDVDATLFPRRELKHVGIAPLTSMYLFNDALDQPLNEDYRRSVHNSEGLQIQTGRGEMLWRPLMNPETLQISAFMDETPQGFGLIQRKRDFANYLDLEANYQKRPSAWVKPLNDWGKGHIELVEIPSRSEINDNIVTYWQPEQPLKQGEPFNYSYRLTMTNDTPVLAGQPHIVRSAQGHRQASDDPQIVIDFNNIEIDDLSSVEIDSSISEGRILDAHLMRNPYENGLRAFVTFDPEDASSAEIRVQLKHENTPLAATWLYRWLEQ